MPDPRVVIARHPNATEAFVAKPEIVKQLVNRGIASLAGTTNETAAWLSFVSPTNVIGIKVYSVPGALSGTRPSVVAATLEGLLAAGIPATNIIIWDKQLSDLHLAGYSRLAAQYGVRVAGSIDAGYDPLASYENPLIGNLVWGDLEFDRNMAEPFHGRRKSSSFEGTDDRTTSATGILGRKSHVSQLLTRDIQKIISITPLLNHNGAGISGHLYGLAMGSVDNTVRFESDRGRLSQAVPEICALPSLGDKLVLNITDALVCQYEGAERALLHYSAMLNELWFSRDPVALDALGLAELAKQRGLYDGGSRRPPLELYSNGTLLELGQSDTNLIPVRRIDLSPDR